MSSNNLRWTPDFGDQQPLKRSRTSRQQQQQPQVAPVVNVRQQTLARFCDKFDDAFALDAKIKDLAEKLPTTTRPETRSSIENRIVRGSVDLARLHTELRPQIGAVGTIVRSVTGSEPLTEENKLTAAANIIQAAGIPRDQSVILASGFERCNPASVRSAATLAAAFRSRGLHGPDESFDLFMSYLDSEDFPDRVKFMDSLTTPQAVVAPSSQQPNGTLDLIRGNDFAFDPQSQVESASIIINGRKREIPYRTLKQPSTPIDTDKLLQAIQNSTGETRQELAVSAFLIGATGSPSLFNAMLTASDKGELGGLNLRGSEPIVDAALVAVASNRTKSATQMIDILVPHATDKGLDKALEQAASLGNKDAVIALASDERKLFPAMKVVIKGRIPGILPALAAAGLDEKTFVKAHKLAVECGNGLAKSQLETAAKAQGLRDGF